MNLTSELSITSGRTTVKNITAVFICVNVCVCMHIHTYIRTHTQKSTRPQANALMNLSQYPNLIAHPDILHCCVGHNHIPIIHDIALYIYRYTSVCMYAHTYTHKYRSAMLQADVPMNQSRCQNLISLLEVLHSTVNIYPQLNYYVCMCGSVCTYINTHIHRNQLGLKQMLQ